MLMEAKYLEITLVMHFKCSIGGKGENLESFCPPELLYGVTKLFCGLCLWRPKYLEITLVMHFKCYIGGKGENLSDRTFVRGN